jgi:hypothetical protein
MHRAAKNLKRAGVRPMLRSATIALGMVALMVTINLLSSNPFTDGVAAVAETGGWDLEMSKLALFGWSVRRFEVLR